MALLWFDSADYYGTAELELIYDQVDAGVTIVEDVGRCGTDAIQIVASPSSVGLVKGVAASGPTVITSFGVIAPAGSGKLFTVFNGGTPILEVYRHSNGSFSGVINPNAAFPTTAWTSDGGLLPAGVMHYVGFHSLLDTGSAGTVEIHIDGFLAWSTSGITTVASSDGTDWNGIALADSQFTATFIFDDWVIQNDDGAAPWNDLLGDVHAEWLQETGPGALTQWDLTGAATNWEAVLDAVTVSTASRISTSVTDEIDTYEFQDLALVGGLEVFGVKLSALATKETAGDRAIEFLNRHSGANHEWGTLVSIPTGEDNYAYRSTIRETDPRTSAAWAPADINADQFGVKLEI